MEDIAFKNIYEGEYMISKLITKDNGCYSHFHYESLYPGGTNLRLQLITYNPIHETHFLLHQTHGVNGEDALKKMYDHIYNIKELLTARKDVRFNSYTIEWMKAGVAGTNHSHFYGASVEEIMRKFYYGKNKESYTILSVRLNPKT